MADVVEVAQESATQIIQEVAALTQNYKGFKQRMLDEVAKQKASRSGSGRATGEC